MLEPSGDLDLAVETVGTEAMGQLGQEHFQRDRSLVLDVLGQIDRGHTAAAQLAVEQVAIAESLGELSRKIGQKWLDCGEREVPRICSPRPPGASDY